MIVFEVGFNNRSARPSGSDFHHLQHSEETAMGDKAPKDKDKQKKISDTKKTSTAATKATPKAPKK